MTDRPPQAAPSSLASGRILALVRGARARTRADLVRMTGLSRSTVAQRVDDLLAAGLLVPGEEAASTGGRPPGTLAFNAGAGIVLAADCGASHTHVAVADLAGELVARERADVDVTEGPRRLLAWLERAFARLLDGAGLDPRRVRGAGIGLPGPVEHRTGRPIAPPLMPGWDGFPVADRLAAALGTPVVVDNDVNMMALGEHRTAHASVDDLLFVKAGTGIGCGLVLGGRIHRGAHGAAGDVGHVHVPGHDDVHCACGNVGCLEAVAGGGALARRLSRDGRALRCTGDVVEQVLAGEPEAVARVREAGRTLGGVLATLVNLYDPEAIVIGGRLADAERPLLAGAREVVYRRSLPLATHDLRIERSRLGERAGVVGAALAAIDRLLRGELARAAGTQGRPGT